ncbi:hypothetical protein MtrunA17_Chr4g0023781 [Medicago truncatula]|uniref:Uncharacterized protein n=1 Tax=Medicago truncatula TaxID=3880 RepID=A0A072UII0_MEDTR|nr:hypothetical protein MTR_4g045760 [Medicago truncatula]RHN60263.1 hypothetical protein MtrunA17_Chr4g0023781 [Medicago truncatula]
MKGNLIISCAQQDMEVRPKSLESDMNYVPLVVVLDPDASGPNVAVIPDLVATELTIINASDPIAIESTNAIESPKIQHVVISPTSTGYNNEFWGQFLQDES